MTVEKSVALLQIIEFFGKVFMTYAKRSGTNNTHSSDLSF